VLGMALAIKMVAYVLVAPVANAFTGRLPRRAFLVSTDLVRAGVALILPFVGQVWQVYLLVFVLQVVLGGLHADLPGDHPGHPARRSATTPGRCRSRGSPTTWRICSVRRSPRCC
jgi:MFS family permease